MADNVPPKMNNELIASLKSRSIDVSVEGSKVSFEIDCGDELMAQVLFEDIADRLDAGRGISLNFGAAKA